MANYAIGNIETEMNKALELHERKFQYNQRKCLKHMFQHKISVVY